jgi:outer membrane lipoprotein SlyB
MTVACFAGLMSYKLQTEAVVMRKPVALVTVFTALALILGGCASSLTGDSYSRDEARAVQTVRMGTIESLRPVKIEGT